MIGVSISQVAGSVSHHGSLWDCISDFNNNNNCLLEFRKADIEKHIHTYSMMNEFDHRTCFSAA